MIEVSKRINQTEVTLVRGDITKQEVDAIVNAANKELIPGGGVDGAIHRAGGPAILAELDVIRDNTGGCPPGQAVTTGAGNLPCRYVIHTVGPIWHAGVDGEPEVLSAAYRNSLKAAARAGAKTVAFPSISTGAYGYPLDRAAEVAMSTVEDFCRHDGELSEIRFVLFDDRTLNAYRKALDKVT